MAMHEIVLLDSSGGFWRVREAGGGALAQNVIAM